MNTIIKKITFNQHGELAATFSLDGDETISISKVSSSKCLELYNTFRALDFAFTEYLLAPYQGFKDIAERVPCTDMYFVCFFEPPLRLHTGRYFTRQSIHH